VSTKKVTRSSSSASSYVSGPQAAVPAGVTGALRRFWDFASKTAKRFGKECKDPDKREEEFMKIVRRDSSEWK
jgi:hypothetical protein